MSFSTSSSKNNLLVLILDSSSMLKVVSTFYKNITSDSVSIYIEFLNGVVRSFNIP